MQDDERCCGTGTCLINDEGQCWCGQKWNGTSMCFDSPVSAASNPPLAASSTDQLLTPTMPTGKPSA